MVEQTTENKKKITHTKEKKIMKLTKQSSNLLNSLSNYTKQDNQSLVMDLSIITQESLGKQTSELLAQAQNDYANGKTYKDDMGFDLTLEQVETAIKSRFGRYMKWDFVGIKTFNERLLKDIAYGLNLNYQEIKNLAKDIQSIGNGVLIFKDGATMDFVEVKEGKVVNPQALYSEPKMLANGKFHRFAKEVVAIIA